MGTVTDPRALSRLIDRLAGLRPDTPRRWGTLAAGEMLCHLADATASVLGRPGTGPTGTRWLVRWLALYAPIPWPRGVKTPAHVDPKLGGTRPGDFEHDRQRAVDGLHQLAGATAGALPVGHFRFGRMRPEDWHRWGYRHTDHHLRQFGL